MSHNSAQRAIRQCPENGVLAYTTTWYYPAESPNFTICSRCYTDKIGHTPFASQFRSSMLPSDPNRHCLWNTKRVESLLGYGLSNNTWEPIRQYMIHRPKIQHCTGPRTPISLSSTTGRYRWYRPLNSEIEGFVCCEGCYEDLVSATSFRDRFILDSNVVNHGNQATCDMCVPFIKKCLLEHAPTQNWTTFVEWTSARLKIPSCKDIQGKPCSSTLWYMPLPPIHNLVICGECYHDGADLTPLASSFSQIQIPPNRRHEVWECANSIKVLAMMVTWNEACDKKNLQIWQNAARIVPTLPPCTKEGIRNVKWYTLSGCPNFAICGRCFIGIAQTYGMDRFFQQTNGPTNGSVFVCDFHPEIPRSHSYYGKFDEAIALQDFSIFHNFVARVSCLPVCPKDSPYRNRRWYCGDDATICESCYEEAIRGTSLAYTLTLQERPGECICDCYTPRMRGLWHKACAENDIQSFNAALRQRMQVYQATVPRMRQILAITKMRANTQATLFMSSIMLQGANNIVSASASHHPYQYGNAQLGWWDTPVGAQGAAQFQQAVSMNIAPTGDMAEMTQLGAIWKQYE
ncbi:conserved hypothetical protein [Talaromyces stipitatus ATCC 10500]|uniref:Integral membrane protein n=1 Tax=Talaromyces stipitatus (strain ATCC 10500 / CBS 375.48 / QM 6759 / NRRL 1006) TaxID=441959 RepID=B8MM63_TALSN|nr:uncharacterized protein TSTA_098320 [Talaromyces stipitatus ATCC 10500]EED13575.1 conserved hypothetical protein [Talaromyces stipitatus ATCC 10500]